MNTFLTNSNVQLIANEVNSYLKEHTNILQILQDLHQTKNQLIDYKLNVVIEGRNINLSSDKEEKLLTQLKDLSNFDYENIDLFTLAHKGIDNVAKEFDYVIKIFFSEGSIVKNIKSRYFEELKVLVSKKFEQFQNMKNVNYLKDVFQNLFNTQEGLSFLVGNKEIKEYLTLNELDSISQDLNIEIYNIYSTKSAVSFDLSIKIWQENPIHNL